MLASKVTVVLPVFQRPVPEFAKEWAKYTGGVHENTCFEVHYYHCFGNEWNGLTFAQHIREVKSSMRELQEYPIVIGEWSLAIGSGAQPGQLSKSEMRKRFAHAQLAAYAQASHGWFFWTWHDSNGTEWDWQLSQKDGIFSRTMINDPPPLELPSWDGNDEDPLEADFDSIPTKPSAGIPFRIAPYSGSAPPYTTPP